MKYKISFEYILKFYWKLHFELDKKKMKLKFDKNWVIQFHQIIISEIS